MSTSDKGWFARALDVRSHGAGRIAAGLALGVLAGLAPWDSGLFFFALFLIAFTEASAATALATLCMVKGISLAVLDPALDGVGRSLHASPSELQRTITTAPLVALLGLERHSVLGALLAALAAGPLLGAIGFFVQRKLLAERARRERKERKKKPRDDWKALVRTRWTDEVWGSLPPLKKWFVLAAVLAVLPLLLSGFAGRWVVETELPVLLAAELGSCEKVTAGSIDASIYGRRIHARDVTIVTAAGRATIAELDIELDGVSLLRKRLVARHVAIRRASATITRLALPPVAERAARPDREESLASRPAWAIWQGELADVEIDVTDSAARRHLCVKTGELSEIAERGQGTRFTKPEVHLRGDGFTLDIEDGVASTRALAAVTKR